MRSFTVPLVALCVTTSVAQWLPSCSWNDCMGGWQASNCMPSQGSQGSHGWGWGPGAGWSCLCNNATALAQVNTCVATSCTNVTDQEAIYGAIAQLCVNNGVTVTNSQQATFTATSGGSAGISGAPGWGPSGRWGSSAWSSWISQCSGAMGSAPSGWHGGPWGGWGGNGGPWGTKASGIACDHWTTWTAGWGPYSSWTGTWSGCSSTTATPAPATVTTTMTTNGATSVVTGTTFGIQAQQAVTASTGSGNAAAPTNAVHLGVAGGAVAAVFGLMVAL